MTGYQTEAEQVDAIKRWWEANGKFIIIGGIVVVAGVVGGNTWNDFKLTTLSKASAQYDLMMDEALEGRIDSVIQRGESIIKKNPDLQYAIFSALSLAKIHVDKSEYDAALSQLTWVLDNTESDEFKHIARLRLAKILTTQDKLDQALTYATFPEKGAFESQYLIAKGDVYYKKGELESARTAYTAAMQDSNMSPQLRSFIQVKLDDLGDTLGEDAG